MGAEDIDAGGAIADEDSTKRGGILGSESIETAPIRQTHGATRKTDLLITRHTGLAGRASGSKTVFEAQLDAPTSGLETTRHVTVAGFTGAAITHGPSAPEGPTDALAIGLQRVVGTGPIGQAA